MPEDNVYVSNTINLAKYMKLDQKGKVLAEYVWIDGSNGLRNKTKVRIIPLSFAIVQHVGGRNASPSTVHSRVVVPHDDHQPAWRHDRFQPPPSLRSTVFRRGATFEFHESSCDDIPFSRRFHISHGRALAGFVAIVTKNNC